VQDPRVLEFRKRVRLETVEGVPVPDVNITVARTDGTREEIAVKDARGTDNRPLTDAEIEAKFKLLASTYAPDCTRAEALIDAVWNLEKNEDASAILAAAVPAA
ncbi:MAG: hypothetical protein VW835_04290, partial [Rickettsiales bacterium]